MRRRAFGIAACVTFLILAVAGPTAAASRPRIHDNGSVSFASAYHDECNRRTCTTVAVHLSVADDGTAQLCVEEFGRRFGTFSCDVLDPSEYTLSDESATVDAVIDVESCNRQRCTIEQQAISLTLDAFGTTHSYSFTDSFDNGDCTETFSVRGSRTEAAGSFTIDGTTYDVSFGDIGEEMYRFSSTCTFEG